MILWLSWYIGSIIHLNIKMSQYVSVFAKDGTDLYRQVATFAFAQYFSGYGRGAVVIDEDSFEKGEDGSIKAGLSYVVPGHDEQPPSSDIALFIEEYDPRQECVLAIMDSEGRTHCLQLTGEQLGSTPESLFREAFSKDWYSGFVTGDVLELKEQHDGLELEPGYYMFISEEATDMQIVQVGENEHGELGPFGIPTNIHSDYSKAFRATLMNLLGPEINI